MAFKFFDVYSQVLANWLNGGSFTSRGRISASEIVAKYNTVFTTQKTKRIFRVVGIRPINVNLAFTDYIRERMFELNPNVEVVISLTQWPTHISINTEKFQKSMARASNGYSTYKEVYDSQSVLARLSGKIYHGPGGQRIKITKERLQDLKEVFASHVEIYNSVSDGSTLDLESLFIEVIANDMRELKQAEKDLLGILDRFDYNLTVVKMTKTYLTQLGPAEPLSPKLNKKFLPQLLFTDKDSTAFSTYKANGLASSQGILFGVDLRSRLPLMVDLFAAPTAEVFLIDGKTGSGKTYAAYNIALSAIARGCAVSAIDIKGREWSRLLPLVTDSKVITFDDRNPSFVNTLRLDDVDINTVNVEEIYNTAIKGTVQLLMLIVNLQPGEGNPSDLEIVLREAVMKLYTQNRVDVNNPKTFKRTANMAYADLLPILESLALTATYTDTQKSMLKLVRARAHSYLGESGLFAESFKNEITLGQVLTYPLVIYEFNKNQGVATDILDTLRIFMVQFLDSKKKAQLRSMGKFLFCFYEELQRCEAFGDLLNYICADVTGSRSNNTCVFLLLNSLKVLRGEKARDIRSNITSVVCGFVEQNDIETFRDEFGFTWLASTLANFAEHQNYYRHAFAAMIDNGKDVIQVTYRVELPDEISKMFQTRSTTDNAAIEVGGVET